MKVVRDAAIAANPEIMKLREGCRVEYEWETDEVSELTFGADINGDAILFDEEEGNAIFDANVDDIKKILGRPIRLADVLLAIQERKLEYAFMVDQEGGFVTALAGQNPKLFSVLKGWNLLADDLKSQSPETIAFLASILR